MTPPYLCSARRSRGRAEQIGQDSQTSLLWLWSRSNSLPFPEALSAMTQGFHYHHNQRPPFHQPATQKVLLTGDGVCVCVFFYVCGPTHTCPCVCILKHLRGKHNKQKKKEPAGLHMFFFMRRMNMTSSQWWCVDEPWQNHSHRNSCWPLLKWMKYANFSSLQHETWATLFIHSSYLKQQSL